MNREQFVFFRSWLDGVRLIKNKAQRCDAYEAIINYALDGQEADVQQLPPAAAIAYVMAKPIIESGIKKAEAGRRGGKATDKQTTSKPEANASKTEKNASNKNKELRIKNKEEEKEKEKEKSPSPSYDGDGDEKNPPPPPGAVDAYMRRVNPTPSPASMAELLAFERELGTEVCVRAIDSALDENHRTWSYIKAILTAKRDAGVRSAADWDRLEAQRMDAKARRTAQQKQAEEAPPVDVGDLDWLLSQKREEDGNDHQVQGPEGQGGDGCNPGEKRVHRADRQGETVPGR